MPTPGRGARAARKGQQALADQVRAVAVEERFAFLLKHVQAVAAEVLGLGASIHLDPSRKLSELGFDSLMSLELANRLQMSLPATLVVDDPTVETIAHYLARQLTESTPAAEGSTAAADQTHAASGVGLSAIAEQLRPHLERLAGSADFRAYEDLLPRLHALSSAYVLQALCQLGWTMTDAEEVTAAVLAARLGVTTRHQRLLGRLLEMLAEDGVLRRAGTAWRVVRAPEMAGSPEEERARLLARFPSAHAELTLLGRCGELLARVMRGAIDPLQVLFAGDSWSIVENLFAEAPPLHVLNTLARQAIALAVAHRPAGHHLRILEVGAGTGGATGHILTLFDPQRTTYTFSDLSLLFLAKAADKFRAFPFVRYQRLDIQGDTLAQGLARQSFDMVIASHVLHATRDLRSTLRQVRELLAPGGVLVVAELMKPQRWLDLIFGLTEGWWQFADFTVRPSHPLAPLETWLALLGADQGFAEAVSLPAVSDADRFLCGSGALLLARLPR